LLSNGSIKESPVFFCHCFIPIFDYFPLSSPLLCELGMMKVGAVSGFRPDRDKKELYGIFGRISQTRRSGRDQQDGHGHWASAEEEWARAFKV